jgi:tetratricopeptide (TPR) repeat protein
MKKLLYFSALCLLVIFTSCGNSKNSSENQEYLDSLPADMREISQQILDDPENSELYNERALKWMKKAEYESALSDINRAIANDMDNPAYFIVKSDIYFAMGNLKECKDALLKAIEKDEYHTEAILKYAELHFFLQDYETMFLYIDRAMDIDNINPEAYFMRAMAYAEMQDTAKAISDLHKAVEQKPDFYNAYVQLGLIFDNMNNPLALDYYSNALQIDTNSVEVRYNIAMYYQKREELNKAIEIYFDIIDRKPDYKYAYYNLGYIHLVYLEVYTEAVKYFTQAISIDPNYVEAYYNRGYAYELRGDITNARLDYQMALQLKTNYPKAIEGLNRLDRAY